MSIAPPPTLPEVPDGIVPGPGRPAWRWWMAFVALIGGFAGALVGFAIISVIAVLFGADVDGDDTPPGVLIPGTIFQDISFVAAAIATAWIVSRPAPWQFGLRKAKTGPWLTTGITVAGYVSFLMLSAIWAVALGLDEQDDLPDELGADESTIAMLAVAFLVAVMAPLAEEFLFRGFMYPALRNSIGVAGGAIVTGIVFGAIHLGSSPVGFLVPLMVLGAILCVVYQLTHSLYPCIVLHCLNNCVAFSVAMGWSWQIPVLMVAALSIIALVLAATRRATAAPPPVSPIY